MSPNTPSLLAQGDYQGYQYKVSANNIGYRCGYIRLPKNHPWLFVGHYDEIPIEVHGGITYAQEDWIGFDCAHAGDAPDPELPTRERISFDSILRDGVIRTTEFCVSECKSMIDQAIAANRRGTRLRNRLAAMRQAWKHN